MLEDHISLPLLSMPALLKCMGFLAGVSMMKPITS